ncbi:MAG: dihydropteroate synthase [candidate division WOR-3 bacterium]|nr:dihydropteroate synthase [candidate division WOR-3 bacterium]MCX7947456.1 dihydropteroate synthase [candidate division WOR-3 bacterium]MDW8150615.1 dihydropteroate synthase [candidate division WOR-3 bacterium]
MNWKIKDNNIELSDKPIIMGILNITPDSFYEKSRFMDIKSAIDKALEFIEYGAKIIDIGGQSTRPFSDEISEEEEINRVIPVISVLSKEIPKDVYISIDTYRSKVARLALESGAHIVNDISGLMFDENMVELIRDYGCGIVIMHIRGKPKNMQENPYYNDTINEIKRELFQRIEYARSKGIKSEQIVIDPGIGFGKRVYDNLLILKYIDEFMEMGYPVLIGHSRKSFIGKVLKLENPDDRLFGSLAVSAYLSLKGINIIRTHDVKETKQVVDMIYSIIYPEEYL